MDGRLVPGLYVLELLFGENFCGLFRRHPVESTHQALAVLPAGKSAGSWLLGFPMKGLFNGGPIVLEIDMGFSHKCCLRSVPLVERLGGLSPFMEIGKSGCHWALDMVPLVWFSPEVVPNGEPCLLHVLDVICWPVVEEGVQCPDVVDDHLVTWIAKFVADLIVDDVLQPSLVQPKVCGQTLAQCQAIPGC